MLPSHNGLFYVQFRRVFVLGALLQKVHKLIEQDWSEGWFRFDHRNGGGERAEEGGRRRKKTKKDEKRRKKLMSFPNWPKCLPTFGLRINKMDVDLDVFDENIFNLSARQRPLMDNKCPKTIVTFNLCPFKVTAGSNTWPKWVSRTRDALMD